MPYYLAYITWFLSVKMCCMNISSFCQPIFLHHFVSWTDIRFSTGSAHWNRVWRGGCERGSFLLWKGKVKNSIPYVQETLLIEKDLRIKRFLFIHCLEKVFLPAKFELTQLKSSTSLQALHIQWTSVFNFRSMHIFFLGIESLAVSAVHFCSVRVCVFFFFQGLPCF